MCSCVICSNSRVRAAAGVDTVDGDVLLRKFFTQGFCQSNDSGLRRAVGGRVRVAFLAGD
jgi:hypothetical protein